VEMVRKIRHGFIGGLEEALGLRLEPERDAAASAVLEGHQMRGHAEHVFGVARDDVRTGYSRLEAERRALDRWRAALRRDVGEDVRHVDGVLRVLFGPPIGLVDL